MTIDLDALERIAQAATPGPWRWDENYGDPGDTGLALTNDARKEIVGAYNYHCCSFRDEPNVGEDDAEHIAAFDPPAVLALIARVRELEAIVNDGGNQAAKYWTRLTAAEAKEREAWRVANARLDAYKDAVAEVLAHELHHFEEEQARAKAEAERDEALAGIADLREYIGDNGVLWDIELRIEYEGLRRILSRIPEHPKEGD